jgi:hypothetical protein
MIESPNVERLAEDRFMDLFSQEKEFDFVKTRNLDSVHAKLKPDGATIYIQYNGSCNLYSMPPADYLTFKKSAGGLQIEEIVWLLEKPDRKET